MKERPILFRGREVRLILDGRKTMTRRVVRLRAGEIAHEGGDGSLHAVENTTWGDCIERVVHCPYGVPGDLLWVRETCWHREVHHADCLDEYEYCATCEHPNGSTNPADYNTNDGYWRKLPSIFMPRWASRLTLRITSVRVERVREITEEDARAEGCCCSDCWPTMPNPPPDHCGCRSKFANIWDSINAVRGFGWDTNPWVWVVGFERVSQ